jgi:hypothetical protein
MELSDSEKTLRKEKIINLLNIEEKKWNIHMLRKCTKLLTGLERKDFKIKRSSAVFCNYYDREKEIKVMQNMLIEKSYKLNDEEWNTFYDKLTLYETRYNLHPRKKFFE